MPSAFCHMISKRIGIDFQPKADCPLDKGTLHHACFPPEASSLALVKGAGAGQAAKIFRGGYHDF